MRSKALFGVSTVSLVSAAAMAGPFQITSMTVTDLNQAPFTWSQATAINDLGEITGMAHDANDNWGAFVFKGGQMQLVPAPAGATGMPFPMSINNGGVIAGYIANTSVAGNAFYFAPGQSTYQYLKTDVNGLSDYWLAYANAMNESGQIAGFAIKKATVQIPPPGPACYHRVPIQWNSSADSPARLFCITATGGTGAVTEALDINNAGHVVGDDAGMSPHGMFLYRDGVITAVPRPATRPEVDASNKPVPGVAHGVNDHDWVVGAYEAHSAGGNEGFAFAWDGVSPLAMHLGALNGGRWSHADRINESNMVVGTSEFRSSNGTNETLAGFIWHMDFGMVQLPALAYSHGFPFACMATGINERGWLGYVRVVGFCNVAGGASHAVRWDLRIVQS